MTAMVAVIDTASDETDGEPTSEAALVARARQGDSASFEALYRAHSSRVYGLAWRLCGGDEALAADMVQESFLKAWQKLALFRGESAFGTWLHRLVVNHVLSERRRLIRRREREQPIEDLAAPREASVGPRDGLDQDLERAIAQLPERARTVLILHDVEGLKHKEISELADMAVGTSKAQLHRARNLLKEWLSS